MYMYASTHIHVHVCMHTHTCTCTLYMYMYHTQYINISSFSCENSKRDTQKQDILRPIYICFVMTMYQSLLMALVSVYTKAGAWRSKCKPDCSLSKQIFDELTEALLQGSKWQLPHVWNSTTYYTCLLKILE